MGWNLPDDVGECRSCGVPVPWPMRECDDCAAGRDPKTGRFVRRPAPIVLVNADDLLRAAGETPITDQGASHA